MILSEITPDIALADLLNGEVSVQVSASKKRAVKAYAQAQQPQTPLADEFITVQGNGATRSLTRPYGWFTGNVALAVYCKANADGTAKHKRVSAIINQCIALIHGKVVDGYYFELNIANIITPTTTNLSTGYSMTVMNIGWRTSGK